MTEVRQTAGGPAVLSTTLVQCDQIAIVGDGSHERPLRATGSGSRTGGSGSPVISDQVTVVGLGTIASPLRAGDVPVAADGSTILGDGTKKNPLDPRDLGRRLRRSS